MAAVIAARLLGLRSRWRSIGLAVLVMLASLTGYGGAFERAGQAGVPPLRLGTMHVVIRGPFPHDVRGTAHCTYDLADREVESVLGLGDGEEWSFTAHPWSEGEARWEALLVLEPAVNPTTRVSMTVDGQTQVTGNVSANGGRGSRNLHQSRGRANDLR